MIVLAEGRASKGSSQTRPKVDVTDFSQSCGMDMLDSMAGTYQPQSVESYLKTRSTQWHLAKPVGRHVLLGELCPDASIPSATSRETYLKWLEYYNIPHLISSKVPFDQPSVNRPCPTTRKCKLMRVRIHHAGV